MQNLLHSPYCNFVPVSQHQLLWCIDKAINTGSISVKERNRNDIWEPEINEENDLMDRNL